MAGRGTAVVGLRGPELDGAVVAGPLVGGRAAVEVVSGGTGAGVCEADVVFTGGFGAVSAGAAGVVSVATAAAVLRETADVAGTVSPANAGPADAARLSAMSANT